MSTEGCEVNKTTVPTVVAAAAAAAATTTTTTTDGVEIEYFYLYRISYAWYALMGFLLTMLVGYLVSLPLNSILGGSEDSKNIDPDLLFPWLSKNQRMLDDKESDEAMRLDDAGAKEDLALEEKKR